MATVGERLRERREERELSQGQVAAYEGISPQYLSKLELGTNEPGVWDLLARLARRYETSADYILGLTDDPVPRKRGESLPAGAQPLVEAVSQLSPDGFADLEEAVRQVVEEDRQRQEDIRIREAYARMADHMLDDAESELLAQAILLARSGDMDGAMAIINDIAARFRGRGR